MCPTHSRAHVDLKLQGPRLLVPSSVPLLCWSLSLPVLPHPCVMLSSLPFLYLFFFLYSLSYSFWSPDTFISGPHLLFDSFFPLLVSSLCSFSLPLPLSSLFTEGSPPIPYTWFFWDPDFFSYFDQFPFWAKPPVANCLGAWLIFRKSSKGGAWFIKLNKLGWKQYNWILGLKTHNFYCGSSNLKTKIILSFSQAAYEVQSHWHRNTRGAF